MRSRHALLTGLAAALVLPPLAAPANVPGQVNFQGLLLDAGGQPVTGSADLVFELFATAGDPTVLWSESHPGVAVQDGVYQVTLGDTTPLTAALLAGGSLYLEINIDGETLSPRQRLLAVPYAVRAETAENAENLGGVTGLVFSQVYEHFAFDGQAPPNQDPSEGLADADGDGVPNFLDPDNDADGLDDSTELGLGSDINAVTPIIAGFAPPTADGFLVTTVEVQGQNFAPGLAVSFGSQSPTPANVTSSSFEVDVGPQAEGTANVQVTLSNGESFSSDFDFFLLQPQITGFSPPTAIGAVTTTVTVQGQDFQPPLGVVFGSQTPAATNVTASSFEVEVGPQPVGTVNVEVTNGNGKNDSSTFDFVHEIEPQVFATSASYSGDLGGLAGADAKCNALAAGAGLTGSFKAWLADSSDSPDTRLRKDAGPYRLVDGTVIALDWADLTDGTLLAPIDVNEQGNSIGGGTNGAWTNVIVSGVTDGTNHCSDWTSASGTQSGARGRLDSSSSLWTDGGNVICSAGSAQRLYCFED